MTKQKLDELASRAIDNLCIALDALWEMAWLHRRMTARGLVAALVLVAARFGLEISAEAQVWLASALCIYLGLVGRQKQRRTL